MSIGMNRETILVTGANGFVGQPLCKELLSRGYSVMAAIRPSARMTIDEETPGLQTAYIQDLSDQRRWSELLHGVDTVVHLAARVHVMKERASDPLAEFRRVNVEGTRALATQAKQAGVRRFVYLSSIKVNGEATPARQFRPDDVPGFLDPYGQSKWEAEQSLQEVAHSSPGMEWVTVRPTLVYGPGVRGNFLNLLRFIDRGIPLPLGSSKNRRSLVSVFNLVDLLATVIRHPAAANNAFLVKDAEDLSTADLIRRMADAMQKQVRLLSVPPPLLIWCAHLLRQEKVAQRLLGSLVVNTDKTTKLLGWQAPMSMDCALKETCSWFQHRTAIAGRA